VRPYGHGHGESHMTKIARPHGLWDSPVTPASLAGDLRLGDMAWDTDGRTLVWLEGRSDLGVLVAQDSSGDGPRDVTAPDESARAEVGYGGGDVAVADGFVYYAVLRTGRLFRRALAGGPARPVTPAFGQAASPAVSPDGRWLAYVHHDEAQVDRLAVVDAEGRAWPRILAEGHDFFMQPRWSPDGRHFAWIAWDHPRMPWDGTLLYLARVERADDGWPRLAAPAVVAGGDEVAAFQPEFTPDGRGLLFVSDETGWGQISMLDLATGARRRLTSEEAEYGRPAWAQGMRTYAVAAGGDHLYAVRSDRGFGSLRRIRLADGASAPVAALEPYQDVAGLAAAPRGDALAVVASAPAIPPRVVLFDGAAGEARVVARASGERVPAAGLSRPEAITWTSTGGELAHGLFYPPASEAFEAEGAPPVVVLVHGGPTSQARAAWDPPAQFFATRGYAVLQVNYRGSTGYGRAYMMRLRGAWGLCDVEDAASGARHLGETGRADPDRAVIMGGSAGGFTVLQALETLPDAFAAGVCQYGVSNQFDMATDTHKFEVRYLDSLIGPLPEAAAMYRERSPVFGADRIRRPLALFHGADDRAVPRAQSDAIAATLARTGTPHVYHVYEGEGHGWRKRETIAHFWAAVEAFLREHVVYHVPGV